MTITIDPIPFTLWQSDKAAFAAALGASLETTGFAVISDHPLDDGLIADAWRVTAEFFAQPVEVKEQYDDFDGGYQRGYSPFGKENAKGRAQADQKEFWHTGRALPADSPYRGFMKDTPSVSEVPDFDRVSRDLFDAFDGFGAQLLRAISIYLELEEDWFDDKINVGNSILRLLHYPPQLDPPPEGSVRAGAHEDINLITLLLGADESGLQILHKSGEWIDIAPPPRTLVMNAGDMLQRLTAGYIPSTTHRVLNPSRERAKFSRYSMPFFLHFNHDAVIEPLPSCVEKGFEPEPTITAGDYLRERLIEIGLIKP